MPIARSDPTRPPLLLNSRGSIMVEYAVLLTGVSLGVALSIVALGVPLMSMYMSQRTWVLLPYP